MTHGETQGSDLSNYSSREGYADDLLRVDWSARFPQTFFHVPWQGSQGIPCCLANHDLYDIAKGYLLAAPEEAINSARTIIDELHDERVYEQAESYIRFARPTYVVAPVKVPDANTNALALTYAHSCANFFGLDVWDDIYQIEGCRRDRVTGEWLRLANVPLFYGTVEEGADYVVVDDVFTTGGTLAALRGFIHRHGGNVVVCTTLSAGRRVTRQATRYDDRQMGVDLALTPLTSASLRKDFGDDYEASDSIFREGLKYGLQHLTEQEARFISGEARTIRACSGDVAEHFRNALLEARSRVISANGAK